MPAPATGRRSSLNVLPQAIETALKAKLEQRAAAREASAEANRKEIEAFTEESGAGVRWFARGVSFGVSNHWVGVVICCSVSCVTHPYPSAGSSTRPSSASR